MKAGFNWLLSLLDRSAAIVAAISVGRAAGCCPSVNAGPHLLVFPLIAHQPNFEVMKVIIRCDHTKYLWKSTIWNDRPITIRGSYLQSSIDRLERDISRIIRTFAHRNTLIYCYHQLYCFQLDRWRINDQNRHWIPNIIWRSQLPLLSPLYLYLGIVSCLCLLSFRRNFFQQTQFSVRYGDVHYFRAHYNSTGRGDSTVWHRPDFCGNRPLREVNILFESPGRSKRRSQI